MSTAFLIVSLIGLAFTVNALWPVRLEAIDGPSFMAGWLTSELPLQHLAWQTVATVIFGLFGAFNGIDGRIGLVATFLSWVGLVVLARQQSQAEKVLTAALAEATLVTGAMAQSPGDSGGWRLGALVRFLLPFWIGDRRVSVTPDLAYWTGQPDTATKSNAKPNAKSSSKAHLLDIYRRADLPENCPVYLYIHGGGWVIGDKKQQGMPLIKDLAARGWVCVSINYRLSPGATFPDHLIDAKRALAWVRQNIGRHGGDPGMVVVGGGSAGGHLASLVGLTANDPEYQPGFAEIDTTVSAVMSFFGVYDFTNRKRARRPGRAMARLLAKVVMKTRLEDDPTGYAKASPIDRVKESAPPFFVIHGRNDSLVPVQEARDFAAALRQRSLRPVVYAELPFTQHAFDTFHSERVRHVTRAGVDFAEAIRAGLGAVEPTPT